MFKTSAFILGLLASPAFAIGLQIEISGEANGVIEIDLFEDIAPGHVERITTLASEGAYDGIVFHRVMDGFMAQTGDVQFGNIENGDMRNVGRGGSQLPDLKQEFSSEAFVRGVVGMARGQSVDSANSQFFIMFDANPNLNFQYTVVGKVTAGMDIVDQIKRGKGNNGAVLGKPDVMTSVKVTE